MNVVSNFSSSVTFPAKVVYVGLDVHKNTIALAACTGEKKWLFERVFPTNDLNKLKKCLRKLSKHGELRCCYEASGAGFYLLRVLREWGVSCDIIASSLIPQKPGDKRKNDRLDARMLADYYRCDLLTIVSVPELEQEAARGVVRCRQAIREKVTALKHQVIKFLATRGIVYRDGINWSGKHRTWLSRLKFETEDDHFTFDTFFSILNYMERQLEELDKKILEMSYREPYAEKVRLLRGFRGVETLTAMILVTELGDTRRFKSPKHLMSYVGLVPSLHESGETKRKGNPITKAGSARCRRILVESAWHYAKKPVVSRDLKKRQEGLPPWLLEYSMKAQKRLHARFRHLEMTVGRNKAVVAVARELIGFLGEVMHHKDSQ